MRQPFKTHHMIESKEFWEKVKEQYIKAQDMYLCPSSICFKQVWLTQKELIVKEAESFILDKGIYDVVCGNFFLFLPYRDTTSEEKKQIRIQFLDYCIQKYSK